MQLVLIGINHETADIQLREKFAIAPERQFQALESLLSLLASFVDDESSAPPEAMVLSTCNRTEIVFNKPQAVQQVIDWLLDFCGVESLQTSEYFVSTGEQAWQHLVRVASGLDSLVMGEPQIFGQLKSAVSLAEKHNALGFELRSALQQIFSVAKRVRHDTAIGQNPVSVAFAAVSLARRIFADLSASSILLIGAGETIQLVGRHLFEAGARKMTVANRNLDNALEFSREFNAKTVQLVEIPEVLAEHDIVISSTASSLPLLGKGATEAALKQRKRKPIFMLDLAVPRDIEPQVAELRDVFLYTVDDLRAFVEQNRAARAEEQSKAEEIIAAGLDEYVRWSNARDAVDVVKSYRTSIEAALDKELAKALKQLATGEAPDEIMRSLTRNIGRKVMHEPTVALRDAAARKDKAFLNVAQGLLGLEKAPDPIEEKQ